MNPLILIPWYYRWLAFGAVAAALLCFGYVKGLMRGEANHADFVATVKAEGESAQKTVIARIAADKLKKEKADHENALSLAALRADNDRLRHARAGRSFVPTTTPGAKDPDRACFKRADLERAIQRLDGRISGIVETGDIARVNLDTAKKSVAP